MNEHDSSMGTVVELRVHGVSGTPPEELLDRQLVRQVAGDKTAGFYRPRLREEWRDRPSNDPGSDEHPYATGGEDVPPPLLEGYSWGGLTSGSPSRALWVILIPFTLANVAPRMRPVPGESVEDFRRCGWWVWYLSRVMAVTLTVTMTLGAAGIGLAVLAWQCEQTCSDLGWPLSVLFLGTSSGWRVLWGACFPLALLALLALLSWRKSLQYDLIRPLEMDTPSADQAEVGSTAEPRLGAPGFWYGRYPVSRLRHLHLQAGVAVVGVSLLLAAPGAGWHQLGAGLGVSTAALVLAALAWPGLLNRADIAGDGTAPPTTAARLRHTGWILVIWLPAAIILVLGLLAPHPTGGEMGGYDGLVTIWFAGQSVLALTMFAVIAIMAALERPRSPRRAMGGMGSAVLTILALYLGAAMTSGFVILSAAWITSSTPWIGVGDVRDLLAPGSTVTVPASLQFAGLGTFLVGLFAVAVAVPVLAFMSWRWRTGGSTADRAAAAAAAEQARAQYPDRYARQRPETTRRRLTAVARSIWVARRVDYLPGFLAPLVLAVGVLGSVFTLVYGFGSATGRLDIQGFIRGIRSLPGLIVVEPVVIGVWLIGGLAVGVVVLSALAFRVPRTRKLVGIVWDIGAFWPRDVHPLAPPCYAERAVPELAMRLGEHAAMVAAPDDGFARAWAAPRPPGLVVLASHSQGTVLSMAALLGPGRGSADRTVLLTFGTVLRRLYARMFPLYFSAAAFQAMARRLGDDVPDLDAGRVGVTAFAAGPWSPLDPGLVSPTLRWRNLWRRTDYLGGRIADPLSAGGPPPPGNGFRDQLDVELTDPLFLPGRGDSVMPTAGRHSNFPRDPDFQAQLMHLVRRSLDGRHGDTAPAAGWDAGTLSAVRQTQADGTQADGTQADGTQADGTQVGGTQADGTQADGTQADGTQADGTQVRGTQAEGTRAGRFQPERTQVERNRVGTIPAVRRSARTDDLMNPRETML